MQKGEPLVVVMEEGKWEGESGRKEGKAATNHIKTNGAKESQWDDSDAVEEEFSIHYTELWSI